MLSRLGKYEIRRELGRGAMGIVYEGFDPFIERTVAIKTIQKSLFERGDLADVLIRFRREAQAAGRLNHPGIVAVYEYGEEDDIAFIAMEYVVGAELGDRFKRAEPIGIRESADIMLQLLDALEYSHGRGVVHRDIKPSNILITREGRVKVADFGIARIESSELTQTGSVLGTPSYMSPEQFRGETVDGRSDLYSAGVILYQMLTGTRPFRGDTLAAVMHQVFTRAPAPPSTLNPTVLKALDDVVIKAMAKRPEERFQTAASFASALRLAGDMVAIAERANRPGATLKVPAAEPRARGVVDALLDEARRTHEGHEDDERTLDLRPAAPAAPVAALPQAGSGLLAGLAREAAEKQGARQSADAERQQSEQRINAALEAIRKYLMDFNRHVNGMEPEISRGYSLDARTSFNGLKWQRATLDARKRNLSDAAPLDQVMLNIRLGAPGPVLLKRPWSQFDATRRELDYLKLRALDDLDEIGKRPRQEWLEVRLAPEFTVQMVFNGNYAQGRIDVMCRNVGAFGVAVFRLQPDDVTPAMMDALGLYLLGRAGTLPGAFGKA